MADLVDKLDNYKVEKPGGGVQNATTLPSSKSTGAGSYIGEAEYNTIRAKLETLREKNSYSFSVLEGFMKSGDRSPESLSNLRSSLPVDHGLNLDDGDTERVLKDWKKSGYAQNHQPTIMKQTPSGHALDPNYARKNEGHARELAEFMKNNPELSKDLAKAVDPTTADKVPNKLANALGDADIKIPKGDLGQNAALSALLEKLDVVKRVPGIGKFATIASTVIAPIASANDTLEQGGSYSDAFNSAAFAAADEAPFLRAGVSISNEKYGEAARRVASDLSMGVTDVLIEEIETLTADNAHWSEFSAETHSFEQIEHHQKGLVEGAFPGMDIEKLRIPENLSAFKGYLEREKDSAGQEVIAAFEYLEEERQQAQNAAQSMTASLPAQESPAQNQVKVDTLKLG